MKAKINGSLFLIVLFFIGRAFAQDVAPSDDDLSDEALFSKIAQNYVGSFGDSSAAWCSAFMESLKKEEIVFVKPVFQTNDGNAPEFAKYNACRGKTFPDLQPQGWSPKDKYLIPGRLEKDTKIRTSDILIVPWNLRFLSVNPDIGHKNFKLYRLPDLKKKDGESVEVIYGEVDKEQDKTNDDFLRLISPDKKRSESGYWIINTKGCYASWESFPQTDRHGENDHYAIVRYSRNYYVLNVWGNSTILLEPIDPKDMRPRNTRRQFCYSIGRIKNPE